MYIFRLNRIVIAIAGLLGATAHAAVYNATPATYGSLLNGLQPGDTLNLAAGTYQRLYITGRRGTPTAWITITGPASGPPAVIAGATCCNAVEITNSSYVAIQNLRIDSAGIPSVFGLSAKGVGNLTHNIRVEGNTFVGQGGSQQTVAISTKSSTWGWVIRGNTITGAGNGMYLGDSTGKEPFIGGLIENNLILNTIGYNLQIKHEVLRPVVPGIPTGPSVTIIRNNVFIRDNRASEHVSPNMLVGGFPASGAGSTDWYDIYGNFFFHNPAEALLQCSGRVRVHDNVFVDGAYTAMRFQNHDLPLTTAHIYNNTIYSNQTGISFGSAASVDSIVTGNLIFAATPISGPVRTAVNNVVDSRANAAAHVVAPSFTLGQMNFYPLPGKAQGLALDLSKFATNMDYDKDFNGAPKTAAKLARVFRGAYAGEGTNPGWKLAAAIKPPNTPTPPAAVLSSLQCLPLILTSGQGSTCTVTLQSAATSATVVQLSGASGAVSLPGSVTVGAGSATAPFTVIAAPVSGTQSTVVTATLNGGSRTATFTVNPVAAQLPTLLSMTCAPGTILSLGSATCTVNLTAAGSTPALVSIAIGNSLISAPVSVTVPSGSASASFQVTAGLVAVLTNVALTASLNSSSVTANLTVAASSSLFQLKLNNTEIFGTTNGSVVAPVNGPSGSLVVRGTGSAAFVPAVNNNGMAFGKPGQQNTNTAFLSFAGTQLGNIFNINQGDLTFYVKSSHTLAERLALPAPNYRWAFDVNDGTQRLFQFVIYAADGRLMFLYSTGSAVTTTYYYVPVGQENQIFGKGVAAKFRLTWNGFTNTLYVNDQIAKAATPYTKATPNWSSAASFTISGQSIRSFGGGYFACDDAIAEMVIR